MSIYDDWNRIAKIHRENYPPGTRIMILGMEDPYHSVPPGTRGTVVHVDDAGTIHMKWDNGSGLGICTEVDVFRTLTAAELAAEQNQRQNADMQNVVRFGDDSFIAVPDDTIDCSALGYFDELECDCWELVKKYCDKLGIQMLPNEDGEQPISFDIAKGIQDHILSAFEDAGVDFKFATADEDEAPTMSM